MRMGEERISKTMLDTKMKRKRPRGRPRTRWIDQTRKDIEMRGEIEKKYMKARSGDFFVIVYSYLCK